MLLETAQKTCSQITLNKKDIQLTWSECKSELVCKFTTRSSSDIHKIIHKITTTLKIDADALNKVHSSKNVDGLFEQHETTIWINRLAPEKRSACVIM